MTGDGTCANAKLQIRNDDQQVFYFQRDQNRNRRKQRTRGRARIRHELFVWEMYNVYKEI